MEADRPSYQGNPPLSPSWTPSARDLGPKKTGVQPPIKNWLREDLRDYMIDLLNHSPIVNECCQENRIREVINEHLSRRVNHNHLLWALINLALWHRIYVEADTLPRGYFDKASKVTSLRDNTRS